MNRIEKKFKVLKENNQKAFIGFVTAGDPNLDDTKIIVKELEKSGTDIIEIGIPYSDPLADGPVIQRASQRALSNEGFSVQKVMETVRDIRKETEVPLLFLVYINTILIYGKERFIADCVKVGIDGLIIPDLPLEEKEELKDLMDQNNLCLIPLVAPTSKDRIQDIVDEAHGFVYCVSSLGVTGRASNFYNDIYTYLQDVKSKAKLPIAVGFGISTNEDVKQFGPYVDGVIVGSAIVKTVENCNQDYGQVGQLVQELRKGL